jgi:hypothetical protein
MTRFIFLFFFGLTITFILFPMASSLTRKWVCRLQCLHSLVRSLTTNDHTLPSHLRLCSLSVASYGSQRLRWKYSNPPPHGELTFISIMCCIYKKNKCSQSARIQTRGLSHVTKFCVALTTDDVSTIWLYKPSITRMVGRLQTRPTSFYEDGISKLPVRWEKCVLKAGEYSPSN